MNKELAEYKTVAELETEAFELAVSMSTEELRDILRESLFVPGPCHTWFVRACEKALLDRN